MAIYQAEIDWAETGAEAEEKCIKNRYELIIMDWLFPDTDGSRLLPRLLATYPKTPPSVIVLSAYATREKEEEALAAGAKRFLTKPTNSDALHKAIIELLPRIKGYPQTSSMHPILQVTPGDHPDSVRLLIAALREIDKAWRANPSIALRRVHQLRALARPLKKSELSDALADLEQALENSSEDGVIQANLKAALTLLNA